MFLAFVQRSTVVQAFRAGQNNQTGVEKVHVVTARAHVLDRGRQRLTSAGYLSLNRHASPRQWRLLQLVEVPLADRVGAALAQSFADGRGVTGLHEVPA
ncbi:hypothetical protein [Microbacterium enclense]|uniref:hypothetical protein n=1 Tax=Microbacterium enclense TaxID=993073 RepID=UPI003433D90B